MMRVFLVERLASPGWLLRRLQEASFPRLCCTMRFAKPSGHVPAWEVLFANYYEIVSICTLAGSPTWVARGIIALRTLVRCRAWELARETELDHFGFVKYQRAFARCRTREHARETELSSFGFV